MNIVYMIYNMLEVSVYRFEMIEERNKLNNIFWGGGKLILENLTERKRRGRLIVDVDKS
jgi:hypothetical protein